MTAPETEVASASLWWDGLTRPAPEPPLETEIDAQYAIVGGGYTGLWTAYFIKQLEPNADVVLVETQQIGHCLLYTSPSPRDKRQSRMPSSA